MALPAYSEAVRLMLDRIGPKALARIEKMLDDPKASNKDVLDAAKLILARVAPEPKVDSAAAARTNTLLIAPSAQLGTLMEKAQARIAKQPAETLDPIADHEPVAVETPE